jgi:benzylsuccinate CoA-transferase BbsF subunit
MKGPAEVFAELKVLDFTWAIAGPWTVKYFADHGAKVIHVLSRHHLDIIKMSPPFAGKKTGLDASVYWANYHHNKYGLSLNMKHPGAQEVVEPLVSWADVVVENFSPGVMSRWKLSYEDIRKINPRIIMLSSSQMGQSGPLATMPGTGVQLTAYAGFNNLTGWSDREPCNLYGGFTDCPAARFGAVAIVAALLYRRRTGKGMHIDLSQYQSGLTLLAPVLLDYMIHGRIPSRKGNAHESAVPHGVYECRGDDCWCAITVFTDEQWKALCEIVGSPAWAWEARFATFRARKENEDQLNRLISKWTRSLSPAEVMQKLQKAGVPCGIVQKAEDLYNDPQLQRFGYFWEVPHPVIGPHRLESQAFNLSKTPRKLQRPSPCAGEHNEFVCRKILNFSENKFQELAGTGVFE